MDGLVLFATGSPILIDVVESLWRARMPILAGIQNRPGPSFLPAEIPLIAADAIPAELTRRPFLVPLFSPANRETAAHEAAARGFGQPHSLIDTSVAAPRTLAAQPGLYVNAAVSLGGQTQFGSFVFVNRGAAIGHHVVLDEFVSIGPGAVVGGQVMVGRGSMIGAGAVVLPTLTIGAHAVVAAGAVVTHAVPDGALAVGNPARVTRTDVAGYAGHPLE
jgi:UDP-3-O-[3-hydroxymyristoyl] glucosamine N-acyltransferase